jgi:hypothetical protein
MKILIPIIISSLISFTAPAYNSNEITDKLSNSLDAYQAINTLKDIYPKWNNYYKVGEFDCSEMSAFVHDYLNELGIENKLVAGGTKNSGHAWVMIGDSIYIECTTLSIYDRTDSFLWKCYKTDHPDYDSYVLYTENNWKWQDADEWDWWNSPIFNQ